MNSPPRLPGPASPSTRVARNPRRPVPASPGTRVTRNPHHPVSGYPHRPVSAPPGIRIARYPHRPEPASPRTRIARNLHHPVPALPGTYITWYLQPTPNPTLANLPRALHAVHFLQFPGYTTLSPDTSSQGNSPCLEQSSSPRSPSPGYILLTLQVTCSDPPPKQHGLVLAPGVACDSAFLPLDTPLPPHQVSPAACWSWWWAARAPRARSIGTERVSVTWCAKQRTHVQWASFRSSLESKLLGAQNYVGFVSGPLGSLPQVSNRAGVENMFTEKLGRKREKTSWGSAGRPGIQRPHA